jgi:hypothetical protein
VLLVGLVVACGDDGGAANPDAAPPTSDVRACELYAGAGEAIEATDGQQATTPSLATDKRYDITLLEQGGKFHGAVQFTAPAAGTYVFYYTEYLPVTYMNASGTPFDALTLAASVDPCADVMMRQDVEVAAEGIRLEIGPYEKGSVAMTVQPVAGEN